MVSQSKPVQYARMHLVSRARARAGITGLSIVIALFALAPVAPTSFAAETAVPTSHPALEQLDTGARSGNSFIMKDGQICDPIRHMC